MSRIQILGFGHAIVDMLAKTTISVINEHQLEHGGMKLIQLDEVDRLLEQIDIRTTASGGSAANTIKHLAQLGHQTAFIGGIGDDTNGNFFKEHAQDLNIFIPDQCQRANEKNHFSVVCITPESERSMATFINEALSLSTDMIPDSLIENCEYVYIEAYLWSHPYSKAAILKIAEAAKRQRKTILLTLADSQCVRANLDEIANFCDQYADYVFANHEEICALMGTNYIDEARYECTRHKHVTWIITEGKHGASVTHGVEYIHLPAISVPKVIDKTGAGDFFAAGFIHGLMKQMSLYDCGIEASKAAAKVIQQVGTQISMEKTHPTN